MIKIQGNEVYTTASKTKKIHRLGEEIYFTRCILFPNETIDNFEEVNISDIPQPEWEENE